MSKENTQATTAPIFTSADVKARIAAMVDVLEMKRGKDAKCSAEQYAAVLFLTMTELGILPKPMLPQALQVWDSFPKNPSAFRQLLEKTDEAGASPASSAILDKYLGLGKGE